MIVGSVKYLGCCIHVQKQTHMASGTYVCYPDTHLDSGIRIYWLLSEKQQFLVFPKVIFTSPTCLRKILSCIDVAISHSERWFSMSAVYTATPEHVQECEVSSKSSSSSKLVIILSWSKDMGHSLNSETQNSGSPERIGLILWFTPKPNASVFSSNPFMCNKGKSFFFPTHNKKSTIWRT